MAASLQSVIQTYMKEDISQNWQPVVASREQCRPEFRRIVTDFVEARTDIKAFRDQLNKALLSLDTWGATGVGWMMEINKIAKYYGSTGEASFRQILTGLTASNLGERIEQFYDFATQQKQALKGQGVNTTVNPGNSAFIISLIAFWLDPGGGSHIYYISLRRGLKILLDAGLLPESIGLRTSGDAVTVYNKADHRAAQQAIETIAAAYPPIKTDDYWAEKFLSWIDENEDVIDGNGPPPPDRRIIPHAPLAPTPEPQLRQRIAELRRHVLIEESLVRRIYHALLAGHVVLTGPPGTGKTELARLIPEILWQREEAAGSSVDPYGDPLAQEPAPHTAYATRLVTATDEWSVRTLIGGLAPRSNGGVVTYHTQHGHLTEALLSNWAVNHTDAAGWSSPERVSVYAPSALRGGAPHEFNGLWLVIDEFNRAPIDLALGEALTALGGSGRLRVPTDDGSAELPLPQDFRIIGTLNSFDRNYLNQISEALKRRFSFIEVLPPTRKDRQDELAIVFHKALSSVQHLSEAIAVEPSGAVRWDNHLVVAPDSAAVYRITWGSRPAPVQEVAEAAWRAFEVIRVFRQLGTAQAIALVRHLLIAGLVDGYTTSAQWYAALDRALCDTVADQLQVLLPDELDVLIWFCTRDADAFIANYRSLLERLRERGERRFAAQIEALGSITSDDGSPLLDETTVAQQIEADTISIPDSVISAAFRLDAPYFTLPLFGRRLRAYKSDRGL